MANPMFAARYKISYNEGVQTIPVHADLGHMRGFLFSSNTKQISCCNQFANI